MGIPYEDLTKSEVFRGEEAEVADNLLDIPNPVEENDQSGAKFPPVSEPKSSAELEKDLEKAIAEHRLLKSAIHAWTKEFIELNGREPTKKEKKKNPDVKKMFDGYFEVLEIYLYT